MLNKLFQFFFIFLLFSCDNSGILSNLDRIKRVGDNNPKLAARMLDSIYVDMDSESKYAKMKYELLKIRLNDKNGISPITSSMAETISKYFTEKGTPKDKQEAYFYTGCVYRDLNDTPRAIEFFDNSIEIVYYSKGECDSILYRDTYSNLFRMYRNLHDSSTALTIAKKEYELSDEMRDLSINTIMNVGEAYLDVGNKDESEKYFDIALETMSQKWHIKDSESAYSLLGFYSDLGQSAKAARCLDLIKQRGLAPKDANAYYASARYFQLTNLPDSAVSSYKLALQHAKDGYAKYDAIKALFCIYSQNGDFAQANKYGDKLIKLIDNIDLNGNRRLATTEYNKFQYNLDRNRLQRSEHRQLVYRSIIIAILIFVILLILVFVEFYMHKKNKADQKQSSLSKNLSMMEKELHDTRKVITEKEEILTEVQKDIADKKRELEEMTNELQMNERQLKDTKEELSDKLSQNMALVQMLRRTKMEDNPNIVIADLEQAAVGKKKLTNEDFAKIFAAIDSLYPDFKAKLLRSNGRVSGLQMQVYYLMRIGLTAPQINNIVDVSRSTIWRWLKKNEWIYKINEGEPM